MNRLVLIIIVVFAFTCCQQAKKTNKEESNRTETQQVVETKLSIGGMHCNHCVASVEKGIKELEGIVAVSVSLDDSLAVVSYDASKSDLAKIEQAVVARGYTVKHE